ncbi:MAG: rhodanese-like domain-containing protein [bacterium]
MKVIKIASVAVAALVGVGSAVAFAEDCAGGVCALGAKAGATCVAAPKEAVVNTEGLATLIQSKVPLKLFDARSGKYDDGQRIPGAQQLSADADEAVITTAIPDKSALVVTYCAGVKCPASKALADRLKKLGYSNVIEYPQGIAGWLEAGKAVDKK